MQRVSEICAKVAAVLFLFTIVHQTHAQHVFATHWVLFFFGIGFSVPSALNQAFRIETAQNLPTRFRESFSLTH